MSQERDFEVEWCVDDGSCDPRRFTLKLRADDFEGCDVSEIASGIGDSIMDSFETKICASWNTEEVLKVAEQIHAKLMEAS